jgi:glucose-6-phosphate-specific signal transduction histidine kinase
LKKYEQYLANLNESIYPADLLEGTIYNALNNLARLLSSDKLAVSIDIQSKLEVHKNFSIHIYRIIQESLSNAIKNRKLSSIFIVMTVDGSSLVIKLIYSGEIVEPLRKWRNQMRGQSIITERLKIVNGVRKLYQQDDWIVEEFKFKQINYEHIGN